MITIESYVESTNEFNSKILTVGASVAHSILGTLTLNIAKNNELELVQDLLDFDSLTLQTTYGESYIANVLMYDFYDYGDSQVLLLHYKMDGLTAPENEIEFEVGYRLNEEMIVLEELSINDLTGDTHKCKVNNFELDFDFTTYD